MGSIYGKELDCSTDSLNSTVSSPLSSEIYTQASYTFSNCKNDSEFRDQFLKEKIKINPEQETRSKKIMTDFLEMLTTELKTDTLFKSLFQKLYYTGSYYDDLRIVDATEFDINLVLKFPFKTDMRVIEYPKTIKSFVKYRLTDTDFSAKANLSEEKKKLCLQVQKTFFENHYLMPNKVKQWMQSIFDKLFKKGMSIENVKDVLNSASGPAKTVKLITKFGYDIDVDLVPVIEIVSPEWPKGVDKTPLHKFNVLQHEQFWFLVPKSYDGKQNLQCSEAECFWRMHFPEVEKKILYKRGMVKPIIKTLKLLRNKQDWKILSSYYLKTVVMWAVVEEPSADYWREENFWDRLLLMLKKLQKFLQERKIPYLFHQSFNLIEKINEDHANNLCFRLKKIISCLEKDYRNIYNFT